MTAVVIVLAAAMVVPAIGPERESAEVEQGLDLRGNWNGTWWLADGSVYRATIEKRCIFGEAFPPGEAGAYFRLSSLIEEGRGKFRIQPKDGVGCWLGIYEQRGDDLRLCWGEDCEQRPRIFRGNNGQHLLILRRVKPRK